MNCWNLSATKAQHAPDQPSGRTPPCTVVAQKLRSVPVHCADKNSQSTSGGRVSTSIAIPTTVSTESVTDANRFVCSQCPRPCSERGGASALIISTRTKERSCSCMGLPLHQCHLGIEPVHEE